MPASSLAFPAVGPPAAWIDTHCHLDAPEFDPDRPGVVERARQAGVGFMVLPAVHPGSFHTTRDVAHRFGLAYALGTHPLCVHQAGEGAVPALREALLRWHGDPRLVAVGEIGLDHFVPALQDDASRRRQHALYTAQLALASEWGLPVILHVRRSADGLLKALRALKSQGRAVPGGIAHAFNGSLQQARAFTDLGFCLGFGGTLTFERSLQIRRLATHLPDTALVLETDAPDIPPHWLYRTAAQRAQGQGPSHRNEPAELPRIAATLAQLRGWSLAHTAAVTGRNAGRVLPRLAALMAAPSAHGAPAVPDCPP